METKIISISEDQNTITHESGFVSVFAESMTGCDGCVYFESNCIAIPCTSGRRNDGLEGIFIAKNH